jgi:hypothetical protein
MMRGMLLTKLNKSDEGSKDRGSERWEYPPGRARIIPDSQQRPVCAFSQNPSKMADFFLRGALV